MRTSPTSWPGIASNERENATCPRAIASSFPRSVTFSPRMRTTALEASKAVSEADAAYRVRSHIAKLTWSCRYHTQTTDRREQGRGRAPAREGGSPPQF
eukprot:3215831-Rhodomonas_salina.4